MLKIQFTPHAVADLEEIKRYISCDLFNPQAATALLALIFEKIRTLVALPQTGARVRTDIPSLKNYRFIPCEDYLVFYRTEEKFISIIRVLYARRDYLGLLEADMKYDENG
jgi:addiction module RelE/StbE family toxin